MTTARYRCTACGKVSIPLGTRAEAVYFAGVHQRLHHAGAPTTTITRDHPQPTTPTSTAVVVSAPVTPTRSN